MATAAASRSRRERSPKAANRAQDRGKAQAGTSSAAEATMGHLDVPGGMIAYDDRGSGPLVMMIPGLGDVRQEYRFIAPKIAAAGYRVVTMDLRGHGGSSIGWPDYRCSALASDMLALIDKVGGPAILVGTSMGAGAAAWAAAEAPNQVSGLVLIGPFVRAAPPASGLSMVMLKATMALALNGPWKVWAWLKYYDSLYPTRKPPGHATYRARLAANLREPGRFAALKGMMNASKAEVEPRLAEIKAPSMVLMGSKDSDFPDPAAEASLVAGMIPECTSQMIEGAGHYPHAEMPDEAAEAILAYLGSRAV